MTHLIAAVAGQLVRKAEIARPICVVVPERPPVSVTILALTSIVTPKTVVSVVNPVLRALLAREAPVIVPALRRVSVTIPVSIWPSTPKIAAVVA